MHEYILERKSARSWQMPMVWDSMVSYRLQWSGPMRLVPRTASRSSSSFVSIIS